MMSIIVMKRSITEELEYMQLADTTINIKILIKMSKS